MPRGTFFDDEGKRRITDAVMEAESKTAGEIVVVVSPASDAYRHVDLLAGLVVAGAVLCVFLYHPAPFDFTFLPCELAAAFAIGFAASLAMPALKRTFVRRSVRARAVRRAACAAFVSQTVHRTRGRTGVLVFVSALERAVEIVADIGVATPLDRTALERAAARRDVGAFAGALVAMGAKLGETLPRADDDVNELPDAPVTRGL